MLSAIQAIFTLSRRYPSRYMKGPFPFCYTLYMELLVKELIIGKKKTTHPKLLILVGLPYSGKSTFAEKLSKYNYIHFWATKIKKELQLTDEKMLNLAERTCETLLSEGYSVIFDFLNHKKSTRERFILLAKRLNVSYIVLFFNPNDAIILERIEKNLKSGGHEGRSIISQPIVEEIRSEFQYPTRDENTVEINDNSNIDEYIQKLVYSN